MRRGRIVVAFFTLMLVLSVICIFYLGTTVGDDELLSFYVQSDGNTETIKLWENEEDICYVFLPAYAQMQDVKADVSPNAELSIDAVSLADGMSCGKFLTDREYTLSCSFRGEHVDQKLIFVRSANIPAMYIDTQSGSMDHIHKEKGNEEAGSLRLYHEDGVLNYRGELESIRGRGNTTWDQSKKPYSLRLLFEGDLLNMGAAQNWILLANARDDTHLLNKSAYDLAESVGMKYTPQCEWVDLYLNGEYAGLYLLSERIEVHSERVDLAKEDSFLVSKEVQTRLEAQGDPHIVTQNNMALRIHHSALSESELSRLWQSTADAVLTGGDWESKIDIDSWAMRMLVDEVFGNGDGGIASQFFYGNRSEGKIYAGPVWDMDLCLAQSGWPGGYVNAVITYRQQLNWIEEPLYGKLYQYPQFHDRLIRIYKTVFLPAISELLDEKYGNDADRIAQAASLNAVRWNAGSFEESVQENHEFLKERIAFLNTYWAEEENYCLVHIEPGYYGVWGCFAVKAGEHIPAVYGDDTDGWVVLGTEEPFDITQPVYEDAAIYHKENFQALLQRIEMGTNPQNAASESDKEIQIQKAAPVMVLSLMLLLLSVFDLLRRRRERKHSCV